MPGLYGVGRIWAMGVYTRSTSKTPKFQSRSPEFESAKRRLKQLNLNKLSNAGGYKIWNAEAEISGSLRWNEYIPLVIQESVLPASGSLEISGLPASINFLSLSASEAASPG